MRTILLSLILGCITTTVFANTNQDNIFTFLGAETIEGADSQELLRRAKKWFATGTDAEHRLLEKFEIDDASGKIVIKGTGGVKFEGKENPFKKGFVTYKIAIIIQGSMYSYGINGFDHKYESYSGGLVSHDKPDCGFFMITKKQWANLKLQVANYGKMLEEAIKTGMLQEVPEVVDSDYGIFTQVTASENTSTAKTSSIKSEVKEEGDPNGGYQLYVKCDKCDVTYGIGIDIKQIETFSGTWTFTFNKPDIPYYSLLVPNKSESGGTVLLEFRKKTEGVFKTLKKSSVKSFAEIARLEGTEF